MFNPFTKKDSLKKRLELRERLDVLLEKTSLPPFVSKLKQLREELCKRKKKISDLNTNSSLLDYFKIHYFIWRGERVYRELDRLNKS